MGRVDPGQRRRLSFDARHSTTVGLERAARTSTPSRFMVTTFDLLGWAVFVDRSETKATRGPSRSGLVALGSRKPEAVTLGEDRGTAQRQREQPAGLVQCMMPSIGQLRDGGQGNGHLRSAEYGQGRTSAHPPTARTGQRQSPFTSSSPSGGIVAPPLDFGGTGRPL